MIPKDTKKGYDVREVIARVVDGSRLDEFKARYGASLVCGFAHVYGNADRHRSPTTASSSPRSAQKGAHFIELCAERRVPLLFLQNITGFMVGKKVEHAGIARDGAKMVDGRGDGAGAEADDDHRRLVRRRQLRHVRPRLRPALPVDVGPNARISVMGGEQAAAVLATVKRDGIEQRGGQWSGRRRARLQGAAARAVRAPGPPVFRQCAPVGRRRARPGRHPPRARPVARSDAETRRSRRRSSGVFRM